jgi:hypothetical protein
MVRSLYSTLDDCRVIRASKCGIVNDNAIGFAQKERVAALPLSNRKRALLAKHTTRRDDAQQRPDSARKSG